MSKQCYPLYDAEHTPKLYIYQILLIFCVEIPHQVINLNIILGTLIKITPVILPTVLYSDILILIQVWVSLFQHMFL